MAINVTGTKILPYFSEHDIIPNEHHARHVIQIGRTKICIVENPDGGDYIQVIDYSTKQSVKIDYTYHEEKRTQHEAKQQTEEQENQPFDIARN